jgi:hypothetical protein
MEMPEQAYAEIQAGNERVRLNASSASSLLLCTVDGWYGTPQTKVQLSERTMGHGAYVPAEPILYAARIVTLGVVADAQTHAEVAAVMDSLSAYAGKMCRIAISDSGAPETEAHGYVEVEWDKGPYMTACKGTVTIVCPDPRRYSTQTLSATLVPGGNADGGLDLTEERLAFPLAWGESAASHSVATLHNAGTATAYPTISIRGDISDVTIAEPATGRELSISGYIGWQPIVLDCLSRTASIGGVDVTRRLGRRDFPSIAPCGDTTLALMCSGTNGSVSIEWHDTYI